MAQKPIQPHKFTTRSQEVIDLVRKTRVEHPDLSDDQIARLVALPHLITPRWVAYFTRDMGSEPAKPPKAQPRPAMPKTPMREPATESKAERDAREALTAAERAEVDAIKAGKLAAVEDDTIADLPENASEKEKFKHRCAKTASRLLRTAEEIANTLHRTSRVRDLTVLAALDIARAGKLTADVLAQSQAQYDHSQGENTDPTKTAGEQLARGLQGIIEAVVAKANGKPIPADVSTDETSSKEAE